GAGADPVPQETDRPDQLKSAMAARPLREHGGREDEAHDGREQGKHDVRAHETTFRPDVEEVKRDAQVWVGAANVRACADRSRRFAARTVPPPRRRSPPPLSNMCARSAAIARPRSATPRPSTLPSTKSDARHGVSSSSSNRPG